VSPVSSSSDHPPSVSKGMIRRLIRRVADARGVGRPQRQSRSAYGHDLSGFESSPSFAAFESVLVVSSEESLSSQVMRCI
jgi:hypothetical protein